MNKTNLGSIYGTDKNLESDGKWFDISEEVKFKMKRMGGSNSVELAKSRAKIIKPHLRQIEKGLLPKDVEGALYVKVFVQSCMVDWKGLTNEDGSEIEYSDKFAMELFKETPDLFDIVIDLTNDQESFKEDLGKS